MEEFKSVFGEYKNFSKDTSTHTLNMLKKCFGKLQQTYVGH